MTSGIDAHDLDPAVRPQDDLFRHVNGRWLAEHEIPADRSFDGAFRALHDRAEEQVREIIAELGAQAAGSGGAPADPTRPGSARCTPASWTPRPSSDAASSRSPASSPRSTPRPTTPRSPPCSAPCSAPAARRSPGSTSTTTPTTPSGTRCYLYQAGLGLPDESYYREDAHAADPRGVRPARRADARALRAGPRAGAGRGRRRAWRSRPRSPPTTGTWSRTATPSGPTTR